MGYPQQFLLFKVKLLNLDSYAGLLELSLNSSSFVSRNLLLNSLGSAVNKLLSFLKAKTGDLLNNLYDIDLRSSANRSKDNIELGLLVGSSSAALSGSSNSNSSSSGNTVSLLNSGDELGKLDNGKGVKSL